MEEGFEGIEPLPTGRIYSIEIGQPKSGFRYNVGQTFKVGSERLEIVEILRDDNAFYLHGKLRYVLYVLKEDKKEIVCWKWYEDVPVSVTCFVD